MNKCENVIVNMMTIMHFSLRACLVCVIGLHFVTQMQPNYNPIVWSISGSAGHFACCGAHCNWLASAERGISMGDGNLHSLSAAPTPDTLITSLLLQLQRLDHSTPLSISLDLSLALSLSLSLSTSRARRRLLHPDRAEI